MYSTCYMYVRIIYVHYFYSLCIYSYEHASHKSMRVCIRACVHHGEWLDIVCKVMWLHDIKTFVLVLLKVYLVVLRALGGGSCIKCCIYTCTFIVQT